MGPMKRIDTNKSALRVSIATSVSSDFQPPKTRSMPKT